VTLERTPAEGARLTTVPPKSITKNPHNPRRYFNDERLDLLRTSIQEVGVLVPLIAYESDQPGSYILMDGERRWSSALDLGLNTVPVHIIDRPTPIDNLLRMFNIHAVREDWPLVSIALSLREVMDLSNEIGEARLAERTGLSRSTVRRAKRLLSLPDEEIEKIQAEAHLDRPQQVHREDLYLEIERAESIIRREFPEIGGAYTRAQVIRQFARKRETGVLKAVTEFRAISKIIASVQVGALDRRTAVAGLTRLIADENLSPAKLFDDIAGEAYQQQTVLRRASLLHAELSVMSDEDQLSPAVQTALANLRAEIDRLVGR